jgi:glucose-6-phosphate 1-dehydrogenase
MELPTTMYPESLRDEQFKLMRTISPISLEDTVRGQFKGYCNEPGVAADSQVETFVAVRFQIDSWRWSGVPFLIRAGKSLPVTANEVMITLRPPPLNRILPGKNYFRFRLGSAWGRG